MSRHRRAPCSCRLYPDLTTGAHPPSTGRDTRIALEHFGRGPHHPNAKSGDPSENKAIGCSWQPPNRGSGHLAVHRDNRPLIRIHRHRWTSQTAG